MVCNRTCLCLRVWGTRKCSHSVCFSVVQTSNLKAINPEKTEQSWPVAPPWRKIPSRVAIAINGPSSLNRHILQLSPLLTMFITHLRQNNGAHMPIEHAHARTHTHTHTHSLSLCPSHLKALVPGLVQGDSGLVELKTLCTVEQGRPPLLHCPADTSVDLRV